MEGTGETDSAVEGRGLEPSVPPGRDPDRPLSTSFFFAYLATVRIPLRCPTRPVCNRLRVCLDGGKAARKGPRIPLPRQRVSLSGPEASIFDLPRHRGQYVVAVDAR